jgi:hypothetical protein
VCTDDLSWVLPQVGPERAEAVLHALAAEERLDHVAIPPEIALPAAEQWSAVEEMMDRFRDLGITASRREARDLHAYAMRKRLTAARPVCTSPLEPVLSR